jgi:hypothetical protein
VFIASHNKKYELSFSQIWIEEPASNVAFNFIIFIVVDGYTISIRTPESVIVLIAQTIEECVALNTALSQGIKEVGDTDDRTTEFAFTDVGKFEGIFSRGKVCKKNVPT